MTRSVPPCSFRPPEPVNHPAPPAPPVGSYPDTHLQVVRRDNGNVGGPDTRVHQRLDVQADEAHFTWGETGGPSARGALFADARHRRWSPKHSSSCDDRRLSRSARGPSWEGRRTPHTRLSRSACGPSWEGRRTPHTRPRAPADRPPFSVRSRCAPHPAGCPEGGPSLPGPPLP